MDVARQGYRVIFEPKSVANDPQPLASADERRRKTRTLSGNFQMFFRYPSWLNPIKSPLWWRVFSHKYCRLAAPVALVTAYVSSAFLTFRTPISPFGATCFWVQSLLYTLAIIGFLLPKISGRICSIPAAFVFLNVLVINGFINYLRNLRKTNSGWN